MEIWVRIGEANGFGTAVIGISVVFMALTTIWLATEAYVWLFRKWKNGGNGKELHVPEPEVGVSKQIASEDKQADAEAIVAMIAAVIDEENKQRRKHAMGPEPEGEVNPWVMEGRLRAMTQKPR